MNPKKFLLQNTNKLITGHPTELLSIGNNASDLTEHFQQVIGAYGSSWSCADWENKNNWSDYSSYFFAFPDPTKLHIELKRIWENCSGQYTVYILTENKPKNILDQIPTYYIYDYIPPSECIVKSISDKKYTLTAFLNWN